MIAPSYIAIKIIWNSKVNYFIWINEKSEDEDGVVLSEKGNVLIFSSLACLHSYCEREQISLSDDGWGSLDLDQLKNRISLKNNEINCSQFLNLWNFLGDIGWSIGTKFEGYKNDPVTDGIYEKLYYGNYISSHKSGDIPWNPEWTKKELKRLSDVLSDGLRLFELKYEWVNCKD